MKVYDASSLTKEVFEEEVLRTNVPCVVRGVGATDSMPLERLKSALNMTNIVSLLGRDALVPVVRCGGHGNSGSDYFQCVSMPLGSFADAASNDESLYLKDWHFLQEMPGLEQIYSLPPFLEDDWLNAYCLRKDERTFDGGSESSDLDFAHFGGRQSDYRFVYAGTSGNSWTPLHHDVFGSYSWSYNVSGRKLWFFASQGCNDRMVSEFAKFKARGSVPNDIRVLTGYEYDCFVQEEGDLVFVPSMCYHQVHNIGDAGHLVVSINHNWLNEFCIDKVMELFEGEVKALRSVVDDDTVAAFGDDWLRHVERMLMCSGSWGFSCIEGMLRCAMDDSGAAARGLAVLARAKRLAQ